MGLRRSAPRTALFIAAALGALALAGVGADAQPASPAGGAGPAQYWTPARQAAATPRDLVVDHRGLAYLKRTDRSLEPYGHAVVAEAAPLRATIPPGALRQGGGGSAGTGDGQPPVVADVNPAEGTVIGTSHGFRATVTDVDGIRSVDFVILSGTGSTSTFRASALGGDRYGVDLQNFTVGAWSWWVVARDNAKPSTSRTSPAMAFEVSGDAPTPQPDLVVNSEWTGGGWVQTAAGRLYFEMPANKRATRWNGYVCSGTAVTEEAPERSIVLTAAHCVYDDVNKAFARNVLFIPNQAGSPVGTDRDCFNDPLGCWTPSFGVVDAEWVPHTFPANIPWDYGFYVVPKEGAHSGAHSGKEAAAPLEEAAGTLPVQFSAAVLGERTHALGYSASDDPNFMYCAEGLQKESTYQDYWLPNCGLSGGASGGPWIQPMAEDGSGPIISVNSWGYTNSPGMGAAPLTGSASCVFGAAQGRPVPTSDRGVAVTCKP
jgi:hypothetical protein